MTDDRRARDAEGRRELRQLLLDVELRGLRHTLIGSAVVFAGVGVFALVTGLQPANDAPSGDLAMAGICAIAAIAAIAAWLISQLIPKRRRPARVASND